MRIKQLFIISLFPILCQGQVFKSYDQTKEGVSISLSDGTLKVYPLTENAVRVKFYKETEGNLPELVFTNGVSNPGFQVSDLPSKLEIKAKNIIVVLDKQTGKLSYTDNSGKVFLSEMGCTTKFPFCKERLYFCKSTKSTRSIT